MKLACILKREDGKSKKAGENKEAIGSRLPACADLSSDVAVAFEGRLVNFYMVELPVADFAAMRGWLRDVLGLRETRVDEANGFAMWEWAPGGRLAIKRSGQAPLASSCLIHLEVIDLRVTLVRLAALGVRPTDPIKTSDEGYRRAIIASPEGHRFCLFEWACE
jgi:predicted enzyme related to lactoylglutathione lyase